MFGLASAACGKRASNSEAMVRPRTRRMVTGLVCAMLALSACSKQVAQQQQPAPAPQPALKTAPSTPIAEKKQELGEQSWDPQWDVLVEQALSPQMLSPAAARSVRSYCPRFGVMSDVDKRTFWAYTFQALAGAEAGLKPTTDVRHTEPEVAVKDSVSKRTVHQEGLLQLTYMDADRYGCDFDWDHDKALPEKDPSRTILSPRNNLLCGVKIMENQILTQKKPLLSASSYWVTLRPGRPSYLVFAKQMKNVPAACRQGLPPLQEAKAKRPGSGTAAGHAVAAAN
jgi:hypothetical protein